MTNNPCKYCGNHIRVPDTYHQPIYNLVCEDCVEEHAYFFVAMGHVDYEGDDALGVFLNKREAIDKIHNDFTEENEYYWEWYDIKVFDKDSNWIGNLQVN